MVLLILCMVGALSIVVADGQSAPQVTDPPLSPAQGKINVKTSTTTLKGTIAPIETREVGMRIPSVGDAMPSPSVSATATISTTPTARRTTAPTPEETPLLGSLDDDISATSYFQWGLAFATQGEYKAAISEFEKSLARNPNDLNVWYHLALCAEALGNMEQAYNSYTYVLRLDPTFTPVTPLGRDSSLFQQLQANVTPVITIPIEENGNPNDGLTSFLLGGLLVIILIGVVSYIVRQQRQDENAVVQRTPLSLEQVAEMADKAIVHYKGEQDAEKTRGVIKELLTIASEIAVEGREGKHVGTAFIFGDTDIVLRSSGQLALNPFKGHSEENRSILGYSNHENIKEYALMDGAFIIRDDGIVCAAGRSISVDTNTVELEKGLGMRHVSTAAITQATNAIGIVVSESGGTIRVFANGDVIASNID